MSRFKFKAMEVGTDPENGMTKADKKPEVRRKDLLEGTLGFIDIPVIDDRSRGRRFSLKYSNT